MANADRITPQEVLDRLDYCPQTGVFRWRVTRSSRARAGQEVGSWDLHGYKTVRLNGDSYKLHRLAFVCMTGQWPAGDVDHINGNRSDNRWENLRDVPRSVNLQNQRKATNNRSTGLLGAYYDKRKSVYYSRISIGNKSVHLGQFSTAQEAHAAYIAAKRELHEGNTL